MFPYLHGVLGSGAGVTYAAVLRDTYGAAEVWPLVDIASGTAISAFVNSNRNGTLQGWDLQNAAGPVPGTLAPYSDGANDYGDVYTSNGTDGLNDIFDGNEFAFFGWLNADDFAAGRQIFLFLADGTNYIEIQAGTSTFTIRHRAGSPVTINPALPPAQTWFSIGVRVSGGGMAAFVNGSAAGTATGLGTFAGSLSSSRTLILANTKIPAIPWFGYAAYFSVWFGAGNLPLNADFASMHSEAATAGAD